VEICKYLRTSSGIGQFSKNSDNTDRN
jgi:hypothetical protein